MKRLLIVYHSQSGRTQKIADAVYQGALKETELDVKFLRAFDAGSEDLISCEGVLFGSPENFGYLSGGLKDFFDRTFYPCEGKVQQLPYAAFICAGNDGTGAVRQLERIARGYPLKKIAEPLIVQGDLTQEDLLKACELGQTMAAGINMGIF